MGPQHDVAPHPGGHHRSVVVDDGRGDGARRLAGHGAGRAPGPWTPWGATPRRPVCTSRPTSSAARFGSRSTVDRGSVPNRPPPTRRENRSRSEPWARPRSACRRRRRNRPVIVAAATTTSDRHGDGRVGEPAAGESGTGDLLGGEQLRVGGQQRRQVAAGAPVGRGPQPRRGRRGDPCDPGEQGDEQQRQPFVGRRPAGGRIGAHQRPDQVNTATPVGQGPRRPGRPRQQQRALTGERLPAGERSGADRGGCRARSRARLSSCADRRSVEPSGPGSAEADLDEGHRRRRSCRRPWRSSDRSVGGGSSVGPVRDMPSDSKPGELVVAASLHLPARPRRCRAGRCR